MKKYTIILVLMFVIGNLNAQSIKPETGPIIDDYGASYEIKKADLTLDKNTEYKVIFDIYTDNSKEGEVNPLINTVARYVNMHAKQGVKLKNMQF